MAGWGVAAQLWSLAKLKLPHFHFCDALMSTLSQRALPTLKRICSTVLSSCRPLMDSVISTIHPPRDLSVLSRRACTASAAERASPAGDAVLRSVEGQVKAHLILAFRAVTSCESMACQSFASFVGPLESRGKLQG
jgi:hypothetical protein